MSFARPGLLQMPNIMPYLQLFGHEILAVLCGLVWGLGIGFAIVAAGTFLGELGNFLCVFVLIIDKLLLIIEPLPNSPSFTNATPCSSCLPPCCAAADPPRIAPVVTAMLPHSAFKYCLRSRAEKLEKKKPYYACLAKIVREGGLKACSSAVSFLCMAI
jgi:uncharacterized membrane protein YdjX (TVP38/TMEM64 family)